MTKERLVVLAIEQVESELAKIRKVICKNGSTKDSLKNLMEVR